MFLWPVTQHEQKEVYIVQVHILFKRDNGIDQKSNLHIIFSLTQFMSLSFITFIQSNMDICLPTPWKLKLLTQHKYVHRKWTFHDATTFVELFSSIPLAVFTYLIGIIKPILNANIPLSEPRQQFFHVILSLNRKQTPNKYSRSNYQMMKGPGIKTTKQLISVNIHYLS